MYKYRPVMRAIWCFMDLRQQYWPSQSRGQYCCRRSINPILPNIISQNLLYYMLNVYGWSPLVYKYTYYWNVFNNLLHFPVLHDVTIVTSYCPVITSDIMVAPVWHFYQTIVQYDVTIVQFDITIVQYNVIIVAPWWKDNIWKYCAVNMVFWVSMHHYWKSCDQESTNQDWVFIFDYIIKIVWTWYNN